MARKRRQRIIWPRFLTFLAVCGLLLGGLIYGGVKLLAPAADLAMEKMYPRTFQSYIEKYSKEYGMDENLIYAVCKIESNFQPEAESKVGARGVMQMMKPAFEWVQYRTKDESGTTYDQMYEAEMGIKYGVCMLSLLKEEMGDDERIIMASYHAGMNAVKGWLKDPQYSSDGETLDVIPFSDTNWYVDKVLETKAIYEELY